MNQIWPWSLVVVLGAGLAWRLSEPAPRLISHAPTSVRLVVEGRLDAQLRRGSCGLWVFDRGLPLKPAVSQLLDQALKAPLLRTLPEPTTDPESLARLEVDGVIHALGPAVAGARHLRRDGRLLVVEDRFAGLLELSAEAWPGIADDCPDA